MRPSPRVSPKVSHLGSGAEIYGAPEYKAGFRLSNKSIRKQLLLHPADTQCVSVLHHIHQYWAPSLSQRTAGMKQTSFHKSDLNPVTPDTHFCYFSLSVFLFSLYLIFFSLTAYVSFLILWTSTNHAQENAKKILYMFLVTIIIQTFWGECNKIT